MPETTSAHDLAAGVSMGADQAGAAPEDRPDVILQRLRERILRFAASRIGKDVAEDLVQDTLVLLTTKYAAVQRLEDLVPLAIRIVRFKIMEFRRKAGRRGELAVPRDEDPLAGLEDPAAWGAPDIALRRRELADRMAEALPRLGERCRSLFSLKLDGHRFAEIQRRMGARSINTVYTWDARCRERLRALMGGVWER